MTGRWRPTGLLAAALLAAALSLVILSCGGETTTIASIDPTSTTAMSTTTTVATTTTTTAPTTTTESTTTTTEFTVGVNPEFISKEKTLADVTASAFEIGEPLNKLSDVPPNLNRLFRAKNPGKDILFVGKANRGPEMNAVVTNKLWRVDAFAEGEGVGMDFLGSDPYYPPRFDRSGQLANPDVIAEFVDVVPATSPEEPDTEDFYLRLRNPITGEEMYARVGLPANIYADGASKGQLYTRADLFDLQIETQNEPTRGQKAGRAKNAMTNFLSQHALGELIQPGDIINVTFSVVVQVATGTYSIALDQRGVRVAGFIRVQRFDGNDAIRALVEGFYE